MGSGRQNGGIMANVDARCPTITRAMMAGLGGPHGPAGDGRMFSVRERCARQSTRTIRRSRLVRQNPPGTERMNGLGELPALRRNPQSLKHSRQTLTSKAEGLLEHYEKQNHSNLQEKP